MSKKFTSSSSVRTYWVGLRAGKSKSYYVRFKEPGKKWPTWISLDTTSMAEARTRAKREFDAAMNRRHDQLRPTAMKNSFATLGEISEAYTAAADVDRPGSRAGALIRVVEIATGSSRQAVLDMRADVLTAELVASYRVSARRLTKSKYAINSRLIQAKSVFADTKTTMPALTLPDLTAFRTAQGERNAAEDVGFVPFSPEVLPAMERAAEAVRESQPDLYRAFILFRNFGLRLIEARHVRGSWFETRTIEGRQRHVLTIRRRDSEGFTVKNRVERFLIVPDDLWPIFADIAPEDFAIMPRATPGQRQRFTDRTMSDWVRQFIPDRQKSTYELRKNAGSEVLTRTGSLSEAAKFLGDSEATAAKWYAAFLNAVHAAGTAPVEAASSQTRLVAAASELLALLDARVNGDTLQAAKDRLRSLIAA